jgi:SAM-dependent methyltransferase
LTAGARTRAREQEAEQVTSQTTQASEERGWHTHDWQSQQYVDDWLARDQGMEPERRPLLRRTAGLLPFAEDAPIRVLDVGAGYGALSEEILRRPHARVVCLDYSQPMLDHARSRLAWAGERVSYLTADLRSPDWAAGLPGPFDAVVSSIAIHNVGSADRIRAIYAEVFPLVKPGGCFYNLELLFPASDVLRHLYYEHGVLAAYQRSMAARAGRDVPLAEARAELQRMFAGRPGHGDDPERQWAAHAEPADMTAHLAWLREAGFTSVDCLWKDLNQVLLAGFRPPP